MSQIANDQFPWITSEFFENIFRINGSPDAKVIDFVLSEAVAKGANYGSQMIRALVNYNDGSSLKHKSFIVKTTFSTAVLDPTLSELFRRETVFYRDILPKYKKYDELIDSNFRCAPKCYQVSEDPIYFVFEDLKNEQFTNLDRHKGLTFDATAMAIKKLAKMHALNAKLFEDSPKLFELFKTPTLSGANADVMNSLACGLRDLQHVCLKWPGYEQYSSKIKHFLNNMVSKVDEAFKTDNHNTFETLTHGDLWVNNIMYKFDELTKNPIDVIMVDFQIGYYGSPVLDLIYLLYTSTVNEVREREWDRLVQIYHVELVKSLKLLGYGERLPSLTELQIEISGRSAHGVVMSFMVFRYLENSEHANIEMMMGDSEAALQMRYEIFEKPHVKERTQYMLDYFGRKGFFE